MRLLDCADLANVPRTAQQIQSETHFRHLLKRIKRYKIDEYNPGKGDADIPCPDSAASSDGQDKTRKTLRRAQAADACQARRSMFQDPRQGDCDIATVTIRCTKRLAFGGWQTKKQLCQCLFAQGKDQPPSNALVVIWVLL